MSRLVDLVHNNAPMFSVLHPTVEILVVDAFRGEVRSGCDDSVVLALAGDVDAAVEEQLEVLFADALRGPHQRVLVDMSEVTHLASRGAGSLIRAWATATAHGKTLHVTGANDLVARLAFILGIEKMLEPRANSQPRMHDIDLRRERRFGSARPHP